LTPEAYDQAVYDVVNFLHYVAEPARMDRERLGIYVLLFLVILYVFTALRVSTRKSSIDSLPPPRAGRRIRTDKRLAP
jgi:cytochrome c1